MGFEISTTLMSLNTNSCTKAHTYTRHTLSPSLCLPLCHPHTHTHMLSIGFLILRAYGFLVCFIPFSFVAETNIFPTLFPLPLCDAIWQNFGLLLTAPLSIDASDVSLSLSMLSICIQMFIFYLYFDCKTTCISFELHLLDVMEEDETTSTNRPSGHCLRV